MAHLLTSTNPPQGGEEGTPLQSLLRKPFSPREGRDSPISALLASPARLIDPGKPREKTGADIMGVRVGGSGTPLTREKFLEWMDERFHTSTALSPEEIFQRLAQRLCPICERVDCPWFRTFGIELVFKD